MNHDRRRRSDTPPTNSQPLALLELSSSLETHSLECQQRNQGRFSVVVVVADAALMLVVVGGGVRG